MKGFKRLLGVLAGLVVVLGLVFAGFFGVISKKTNDALAAQVNAEIDMALVRDGSYVGEADGGLVQVEVLVTVANHEITDIALVKHENGKGQAAEAIIADMLLANTDDVDAVTGATVSSKTIRNAVNCALQKGV